jgi:SulP family sulfate permease
VHPSVPTVGLASRRPRRRRLEGVEVLARAVRKAITMPHPQLQYWMSSARETRDAWSRAVKDGGLANNVMSGISTALVAIPLNVALALAADLPASVGLYTGAVAGIIGALLGGTKLQVTGPEVALAPLTLAIVSEHGISGLLWCTVLAGLMQVVFALCRAGRFIQSIPAPVVLGFMVAVGLMVIDAQLPRLFGLPDDVRSMAGAGPSALLEISLTATGVGALVAALAFAVPKLHRRAPAPLIALVAAVGVTLVFGLDVPRVPEVGALAPALGVPLISLGELAALLPSALALALLASLDSLLSAVSIDARLGTRHRSDHELAAQGIANVVSGLVGGMPVAGAIVRSAAAIEAGGTNRVAPLVQSLALGFVLLALGSVLDLLPVTALAAILIVVGVRLTQLPTLRELYRRSPGDAAIAAITVVAILGLGFVPGVAAGVTAALARMAMRHARARVSKHETVTAGGEVAVIRVEGPLHFVSHDAVEQALTSAHHPHVVLDLSGVPALDLTAADALERAFAERSRASVSIWIAGAREGVAAELRRASALRWLAHEELGRPLSDVLALLPAPVRPDARSLRVATRLAQSASVGIGSDRVTA